MGHNHRRERTRLTSQQCATRSIRGAPSDLDALRELTEMGLEITGLFPARRDPQLRVVNFDWLMVNPRFAALMSAGGQR